VSPPVQYTSQLRLSGIGALDYGTGLRDWTTELEYWTGILEWPKLL